MQVVFWMYKEPSWRNPGDHSVAACVGPFGPLMLAPGEDGSKFLALRTMP